MDEQLFSHKDEFTRWPNLWHGVVNKTTITQNTADYFVLKIHHSVEIRLTQNDKDTFPSPDEIKLDGVG